MEPVRVWVVVWSMAPYLGKLKSVGGMDAFVMAIVASVQASVVELAMVRMRD